MQSLQDFKDFIKYYCCVLCNTEHNGGKMIQVRKSNNPNGRPTDDPNGERISMHIRMRPSLKSQLDILSQQTGRKKIDIIEEGIRIQNPQFEFEFSRGELKFPLVHNDGEYRESDEVVKSVEKSINSPFRYAGGKFYARKLIAEHLTDHSCYIEPFSGGASIFFYKPKIRENWLNDLDADLIRVYRFIRDYPEDLIDWLAGRKVSREIHSYYKNEYKPKSDLGKAGRWYFLNRISYSGIMKKQNMYWGYGDKYSMRPENWPRNIRNTSKKLQDVNLTSWDFEKVIDESPDNSLLFVDPPYYNADQDKFYTCSFSHADHFRLCECLKRNNDRLKWFLTYDNIEQVRDLYSWATVIYNKEWNYCIQRSDDQKYQTDRKGKRYKGKEIFILNYKSNGN